MAAALYVCAIAHAELYLLMAHCAERMQLVYTCMHRHGEIYIYI